MATNKIIGICGPCGSGKSTFAKLVANILKISIIEEPHPVNILNEFSNNQTKNSFALQTAFVQGKVDAVRRHSDYLPIIIDRTIEEDREVFFQLHFSLGFLTSDQLLNLRRFSEHAEREIGKPNKSIILNASLETLIRRIHADKKSDRPEWLLNSMSEQLSLYEKWIISKSEGTIIIDTNYMTLEDMKNFAIEIAPTIYTYLFADIDG